MKIYSKLRKNRLAVRCFWILFLLILWKGGVRLSGISPLLFPTIGQVLAVLWESAVHGDLLLQAGYSLWIIFQGLALGLGMAIALALLATRFPLAGDFIDTITAIAHPLPGIAVLPLILIWFGTGSGAVVAIIVHSCLWPVLINLIGGFRSISPLYIDGAKCLSMGALAITMEVRIPASLPHLLAGAKIGWARAWRALISAEMVFGAVGSTGGIGWYIFKQRTFLNTAGLFAGILVVILLGMAVEDLFFRVLERHTIEKWGMSQVEE